MFIRTDAELERLGRIRFPMANDMFRSARFLTAADRMGYSYNENRVRQGIDAAIWLKHHWEANYIIAGKGEVTDLTDGRTWPLSAGVLYVVGPNDRHRLQVSEDMHYVSIFSPPLKGDERFDAEGGYEASGPIDKTDRRMFVKQADEMRRAGQEITIANGQARTIRMLTKADGVGFGFSDVRLAQGAEAVLWYKHHWEANYVRAGRATLEDRTTGERWTLEPGVLYCVGPKDKHRIIRDDTRLRIVSVFNPPLVGNETHDADGAYPPTGPIPPGRERLFVRTLEDVRKAGRVVQTGGFATSERYLTIADGLGFSFHSVHIKKGGEGDLWYKHHWEGNLVLDGTFEATDRGTGKVHTLGPGALYVVGPQDRHHVKALTDVHVISVFDPPLTGTETHDADGAYPPTGPVPVGPSSSS